MASYDYELVDPPEGKRLRELWIQHAAGFILFQDMRKDAIDQIDPSLSDEAKAAAVKAIDDAMYALMQIIGGVSSPLRNDRHSVSLRMVVRLEERKETGNEVVQQMDLYDGDGVCIGIHYWRDGDFGEAPVARQRASSPT